MKKRTIIVIVVVLVVAIVLATALFHKDKVIALVLTVSQKKQALKDWSNGLTDSQSSKDLFNSVVDRMTDDEVNTTYDFVFTYIKNNKTVPVNSTTAIALQAISSKYNIFN